MSTITAPAGSDWMTDERKAFVEAIRDFTKRELGTREQRSAATDGYKEAHSKEMYGKLAELGWLGASISEDHGGSGGSIVDACLFLEETSRGMVPMAGFPVSLIVAGAYERFGTEEQKDEILGGIVNGRVEAIAMSEPEAGSDVGNLQCRAERQNGGFVLERPEDLDLGGPHRRSHPGRGAHRPRRLQARGRQHALRSHGLGRARDQWDRDDGRQGGKRRLPHRLLRPRRAGARPGRRRLDAAHGRAQRRAADHRCHRARAGPARVRRRARLHQGAQAVRAADRLVPGTQAPHRRPRHRARVRAPAWSTTSPSRPRPRRTRCCRARPRW